ncbi:MAG: hypothetical protein ACI8U4_000764 [Natronomonas sp.]|jgi:hypothetical protein
MTVQSAATAASEALETEIGDDLLAVGWYDAQADPRTGSVYLGEGFGEHEDAERGALESSLLESLGRGAYTDIHDEELTTTVRIYETVADVIVPLGEKQGIVVAVQLNGSRTLERLIEGVRIAAEAST